MDEKLSREDVLESEIVSLQAKVERLEQEINELKTVSTRQAIDSNQLRQIGTFTLGAIVLIGIFWF